MAENLSRAGLKVILAEMRDHILPLDPEMAAELQEHIRQKGVDLRLGCTLKGIEEAETGLTVQLDDGRVHADLVLLSTGVRPESELAVKAGIVCNERGYIAVDTHMQTSKPDIYAAGDATEICNRITGLPCSVPLAGPANRQARIAADNMCGYSSTYSGVQASSVLRAYDMTAAMTGLTEQAAKSAGLDYDKLYTYGASHAGYYPGGHNLLMKVLFEHGSGRILGGQVIGYEGVDKRCDVLATAVRLGLTAQDLTELELCYAPPFSMAKDPVNMAGYAIENILTGKVSNCHWPEVLAMRGQPDKQFLDVRTAAERDKGAVDGFVHIPLHELRDRLEELDRSRPVYVHCFSGMRSYLACRILTQNGFRCFNISGGYKMYTLFQASLANEI